MAGLPVRRPARLRFSPVCESLTILLVQALRYVEKLELPASTYYPAPTRKSWNTSVNCLRWGTCVRRALRHAWREPTMNPQQRRTRVTPLKVMFPMSAQVKIRDTEQLLFLRERIASDRLPWRYGIRVG